MTSKKTLVLGASSNPERYSYKAIKMLQEAQHPIVAVGARDDEAFGITIHKTPQAFEDVDTVTLYLSPKNHESYYDYIFSIQPKRIIFNPRTFNAELAQMAKNKGIVTEEACTLVLLSIQQY